MRICSQRSLGRRFRESIRGTRGGRSSCLGLGGKRRHRRRGGGNVEIAPYCDFQGRWEGSENLPLVFLAFHGPPFPRSTSGPSTLTRPSLANFDRRFYPRQTAKNLKASSLFGVGSEKALSRRGFRVDEGSMDCGAGLFGVERVVAESSARRWKCGNRA